MTLHLTMLKAILGNICRCTGYVKIRRRHYAGNKMFRENLPVPEKDTNGNVGARLHRVDAEEKALGTGKYADDIHMDGMIYAKRCVLNTLVLESIALMCLKAHIPSV